MTKRVFMGIDTSNYTTSVALVDEDGTLLANIKRPLPVKPGERGLRQSDAVFAHVKNLPSAMDEAREVLAGRKPVAVGASVKPRNAEGSYMPCFLSGLAAAKSVAAASDIPLFVFSHQCGHIMAALYGAGRSDLCETAEPFAAFHVSGGTTELLRVLAGDQSGFSTELLGGTKDLNAGQIIDRVGVAMGLSFPAGPAMEELALRNANKIPRYPIKADGLSVNLSGIENKAHALFAETGDKPLTAAYTLNAVGCALVALSEAYEERFGKSDFIYAGGVMSNSVLKRMLAGRFSAFFAPPALSSDNAVGIAMLTLRAFL